MSAPQSVQELEAQMKSYEKESTGPTLAADMPVYARIDGRAFHTLTSSLMKPFDAFFTKSMREVCQHLVYKMHADFGYVQSDEISLVWSRPSKSPFSGKVFKLTSTIAGMASAKLNQCILQGNNDGLVAKTKSIVPHFDCRVCSLPDLDAVEGMLKWRMIIAYRNAINSIARVVFTTKYVFGKPNKELKTQLEEAGIDIRKDFDQGNIYGTFYRRYKQTVAVSETIAKMCVQNGMSVPQSCIRTVVEPVVIPSYDGLHDLVQNTVIENSTDESIQKGEFT